VLRVRRVHHHLAVDERGVAELVGKGQELVPGEVGRVRGDAAQGLRVLAVPEATGAASTL
jgi:hypothetical protein